MSYSALIMKPNFSNFVCLKGFDFEDTTSRKEGNPDTSSEPGRLWIVTFHLHNHKVSLPYLLTGILQGEELTCPNFALVINTE